MQRRPNKQKDFFDMVVYERLIPKEHLLVKIANKIDFSFIDEETKELYSQKGRGSYPASLLFKMLFLEFLYNLSDVEVSRQCQYNLLFRYFVGLKINEDSPDDTTLVVFRKRLGETKFKEIFNRIIKIAEDKGITIGKTKVADATQIIADIAIPNTIGLLRQGKRIIINKIEKKDKTKASFLKERYTSKGTIKQYKKEELREEIENTKRFIKEVEPLKEEYPIEKELSLLKDVIEGRVNLVSFIAPEARCGYKEKEERFFGYKAHILEDTKTQLITSIEVFSGNTNEGSKLKELIEKERRNNLKTTKIIADALYDSIDNRKFCIEQNIEAFIPSRRKTKILDKFSYSSQSDTLICPQDKRSISKIPQGDGFLYLFSQKDCKGCPIKNTCPTTSENRARVYLSKSEILRRKTNPTKYKQFIKLRHLIERKFAEAKKWHFLFRARYRTLKKVTIQVLMTFIVMNIKRIIKLIDEKRLKRLRYA